MSPADGALDKGKGRGSQPSSSLPAGGALDKCWGAGRWQSSVLPVGGTFDEGKKAWNQQTSVLPVGGAFPVEQILHNLDIWIRTTLAKTKSKQTYNILDLKTALFDGSLYKIPTGI